MYKVMVQASAEYRETPESILNLYLKNDKGEMVPFSTFMTIERVYGPEVLTRYNMYMSAMINGEPADGYGSGDAIAAVEKIAKESLPKGFDIEWSGMTREEILSGNRPWNMPLYLCGFLGHERLPWKYRREYQPL